MEDAGAPWTTDQPAPPISRGRATPASKAAKSKATDDIEAGDTDGAKPVTPKSKTKISKEPNAKSAGASAKRVRKASEIDDGGEAAVDENSSRKKIAKVTPSSATEEQAEIKEEVKG
jgi:hypothetical protein